MTEQFFEVQDADKRNVGECFDAMAREALERARYLVEQIPGLGPLSIVRVRQRVIIEREELEIWTVGATGRKMVAA